MINKVGVTNMPMAYMHLCVS